MKGPVFYRGKNDEIINFNKIQEVISGILMS